MKWSYRLQQWIPAEDFEEFNFFNIGTWFGSHDEPSSFNYGGGPGGDYSGGDYQGSYYSKHGEVALNQPDEYRGRSRDRGRESRNEIRSADRDYSSRREEEGRRESAILNKNFHSIIEGLKDQYSLKEKELKSQIDQLIDINLSYQRPAVIQTLFQEKQAQSYLPTSFRTDRGSVGGL